MEGGETGNSSQETSPVLRRRQVVRGRVPPDDSSSFETDEDFEKLTSDDVSQEKPQPAESLPNRKPYTNPRGSNFDDLTDKDIYEIQLKNLQTQLEAAVIENQSLALQLKNYEKIKDLKKVREDLERIKEENASLRQHCREVEGRLSQARLTQSGVISDGTIPSQSGQAANEGRIASMKSRYQQWKLTTIEKMLDLLSDFSEEPEDEETEESDEGEELSVKRLKGNIKRFQAGYRPIVSYIKAVSILLSWKSPSMTFLAFSIYMYCAWKGWLITLFLGLTIWLLGSTYFISRGWNIQLTLLPYHLVEVTGDDNQSLSITDKYKLVFHIARKVQNWLGYLADQLEKLYNMIYWGNPEATGKLMKGVIFAFVMSICLPERWLFFFFACAIGWKLFILNALYNKFPRFKAKYDSVSNFFKSLPTHNELEINRLSEERTEYVAVPPIVDTEELRDPVTDEKLPAFCETFGLPATEYPKPGWEGGKRCTLIDKEKHLTMAFRHGRMYLTNSNICFGTSRIHSRKRNLVLSLKNINSVEKAKPFQFIPGHGMSIQISLFASDKPLLFSGLVYRDEVCREIREAVDEARRKVSEETDSGAAAPTNAGEEPSTSVGRGETDIFT